MGLQIAILAAGARGHRPRHRNARPTRRLRPIRPSQKAEMRYRAGLLQLVGRCRKIIEESLGQIEAHWPRPTGGDSLRIGDASLPPIDRLVRQAAQRLGNLDEWMKRMVGLGVEANRDSVDERLAAEIKRAIGVDVSNLLQANGTLLQSMRSATADNIALIKTIPTQYFDRVTNTITEGWTQGIRWESLVEQIQRDGGITENRAKLIARDQTSKMNAAFNQERQQQVGIEHFEWSTSQDKRVRPSHAEMERLDVGYGPGIFSWSDLPEVDGEEASPGTPVNCRCVALPVIDMEDASIGFGTAQQEEEAA